MRDDDLRDQLAAWIQPVQQLPAPDIEVIRRRARRRAVQNAAVGVAAIAVLGGSVILIRSAVRASSPAPQRPAIASPRSHAAPRCAAHDLRISGPGSQIGTMPGIVTVIVLRNAGGTRCSLEGWPTVAILGSRRGRTAVPISYRTATAAWSIERTRVVLRPGASAAASMLIGTPTSASNCRLPTWAITPPHSVRSVIVHQPPGGPRVCLGDSIIVSPIYPGRAPRVSYAPR
jgi:hypothetical protein